MTSLQQRRDAQTRAEISTVAIGLFAEHGFVETTMEDVAVAADVSRRTVYRHYPNKEDLIFEHPKQWLEVFRASTAEAEPAASTRSVVERAVLAVAAAIEASRDDVLPGYGVVVATPTLRGAYARMNRDWLDEYTGMLSARGASDGSAASLRVSVVAGALVGGTDRALSEWFLNPDASLVELTAEVLEVIAPLWPSDRF